MFRLDNRTALVTGAGSGIGAAISEVFAKAGAFVFVSDVNFDSAKNTVEVIGKQGGRSEALQLDVADEASCQSVRDAVLQSKGVPDILVNNAGIGHVGTVLETKGEDLDRIYQVNVRGIYNVSSVFLPAMIERKSGSVINMASIAGVVAVPDRFAYTVSKFAVVGMTKSMALDLAKTGVRINCICPGRVETPWVTARLAEYSDPAKAREEMTATQPVGRMGRPEEIAHAAVYLASDESSFVTGTEFIIDGGWSAG